MPDSADRCPNSGSVPCVSTQRGMWSYDLFTQTSVVRGHFADELLENGVGEGFVALGGDDKGARTANDVVIEIAVETGL